MNETQNETSILPLETASELVPSDKIAPVALFSGFLPVFKGICHGVGVAAAAFLLPDQSRLQRVNAFRIDLWEKGIDFVVTPLQQPGNDSTNGCTQGDVVTGFMAKNPSVKVATNANFTYCSDMNFSTSAEYGIIGYLVSQATVICDPTKEVWNPSDPPLSGYNVPDATCAGAKALILQKSLSGRYSGSFQTVTAAGPYKPVPQDYIAVAGSPQPSSPYPPISFVPGPLMLVSDGQNCAEGLANPNPPEKVAARTAIGLDQTCQYLYLVTLDGLEGASPQYGGGFTDIAQWMILVGAYNAINLDGGGSAVAAMSTGVVNLPSTSPIDCAPRVMNVPYGNEDGKGNGSPGRQRPLGCFLGVIADDSC